MKPKYESSRLRKMRSMRMTDFEWERLKKLAKKTGRSVPEFINHLIQSEVINGK